MMVDMSVTLQSAIVLFPLIAILAFLFVFIGPWLFDKASVRFFGGAQMDRRGPGPSSLPYQNQNQNYYGGQQRDSGYGHQHGGGGFHNHGRSHDQHRNNNQGRHNASGYGSSGGSSWGGWGGWGGYGNNSYRGNYGSNSGSGYGSDDYDQYFYRNRQPMRQEFGRNENRYAQDDDDDDDDDDD